MRVDVDDYNNVDDQEVADCCIEVVDRMQGHKPGVQIQAVSCLFRLLADILGVSVREMIAQVERVMQDNADTRFWDWRFSAVKAYIAGELRKHD